MKASDLLKYKPVDAVAEARKAMQDAGEVPTKGTYERMHQRSDRGAGGNVAAPSTQVAPLPSTETVQNPVVQTPAVVQQEIPLAPKAEKEESGETDKFIYSVRNENGQWVASLVYKNGSGTERFVANSKTELMMELLKGKGYGTLRVKEAVRREKLGRRELETGVVLPPGMTLEEYNSLPEALRKNQDQVLAVQQSYEFRRLHPEYYPWDENGENLKKYLVKNNAPFTVRNLEIALEDLTAEGEILPPPSLEPTIAAVATAPRVVDSAPVQPAPAQPQVVTAPAENAEVLRKRGTTGLQPGHSSVSVEEPTSEPRELSAQELRAKYPITDKNSVQELKRIADADRVARRNARR